MDRRNFFSNTGWAALASSSLWASQDDANLFAPASAWYNVREHGAEGNGRTLDTEALQNAIDACHEKGGGVVYFPSGTYLAGTIHLKSYVTCYLDTGAVLLGSTDLSHYPKTVPSFRSYADNYTNKSLVYAEGEEHIALLGQGAIDGQGGDHAKAYKPYKDRPYLMRLIQCQNVVVRDLTLRNAAMWVQHYLACDNVRIDGVTVRSKVNHNNDGLDIDGCRQVRVSNCDLDTGDDAIVLKSTSKRLCRNVTVANCVLRSGANAFKLGTETSGGFENITMTNCAIHGAGNSGIALEIVDGGRMDRISISNVTMRDAPGGLFIRLGNRARPYLATGSSHDYEAERIETPGIGSLSNVIITNVQGAGVGPIGCSITGQPEQLVENVILENVRLTFQGGGSQEMAHREVLLKPKSYPDYDQFGMLPAYGFFCRYVRDLTFRDVSVSFEEKERRPPFVFQHVKKLTLTGVRSKVASEAESVMRFQQLDGVFAHGNRMTGSAKTFAHVQGDKTRRITMQGNDLKGADCAVTKDANVPEEAVFLQNNRL